MSDGPVKWIVTREVKLAAILCALKFQLRDPNPMERIVKDNIPTCYFYFYPAGDIEDYLSAWESPHDFYDSSKPNHPLNDENHVFWHMRAALRNRDRLTDAAKRSLVIHLKESKGKFFVITYDPNDNRRTKN